jgi:peptidyl-prolyl cis-trans isomerase D
MQMGQIDWHAGISDGIAAYEGFRTAAANAATSDYPEVIQLGDGGVFALRLDEVVAPALRPLDEVLDAVEDGWRDQATQAALLEQAQSLIPELEAGKSFEELSLTPRNAPEMMRGGIQPDTPAEFVSTVFGMQAGDVRTLEDTGRLFIIRLDEVLPPNAEDSDVAMLRDALDGRVAGSIAQDLYQVLAEDIRTRAGVQIDQQALNAVHANFSR